MAKVKKHVFFLAILSLAAAVHANAQASSPAKRSQRPHQDHEPRHGGIFFMAENGRHHLEGIIERPATFRVFLYDVYTRPLTVAQIRRTTGTVRWGDADDAPETPLTLSKDGKTLEATLQEAKLPVRLTLLLHFPGSRPGSKAELFTFPFSSYSEDGHAAQHGAPSGSGRLSSP